MDGRDGEWVRLGMDHDDGKPSRKEMARSQRRAAYQKAKAQRDTDPKYIAMKEALKERRRAAARLAKEKRATDPKQIARKAELKQRRREANQQAKVRKKGVAREQQTRQEPPRTDERMEKQAARAQALLTLVATASTFEAKTDGELSTRDRVLLRLVPKAKE